MLRSNEWSIKWDQFHHSTSSRFWSIQHRSDRYQQMNWRFRAVAWGSRGRKIISSNSKLGSACNCRWQRSSARWRLGQWMNHLVLPSFYYFCVCSVLVASIPKPNKKKWKKNYVKWSRRANYIPSSWTNAPLWWCLSVWSSSRLEQQWIPNCTCNRLSITTANRFNRPTLRQS